MGGFLAALGWGALGLAATVLAWPDLPVLNSVARFLDPLLFHLLGAALLAAGFCALMGIVRQALWLACAALLTGAGLLAFWLWPVTQAHDPEAAPVARVLWVNLLWSNPTPPGDLVTLLEQFPADILLVSEAEPLRAELPELRRRFAQVAGCALPRRCEILVLSRDPAAQIAFRPMRFTRPERIVTLRLGPAEAPDLTIVAVHFLKPWFGDLVALDGWHLTDTLAGIPGPVAVIGDFNAPPWSPHLRQLARRCAIFAERWPTATWPAALGRAGLPIDLVFTGAGARVLSSGPWAPVPGSDHIGLRVELGLAAGARDAKDRRGCQVPEEFDRHFHVTPARSGR